MLSPNSRQPTGYTLIELLVLLALLGLVIGAAAPSFTGYIARIRMQTVLDALTRDIAYARIAAARAGRRVEMRFAHPESSPCVSSYTIVIMGETEHTARHVDIEEAAPGLCLRKNGSSVVSFSSRGRPGWNYSFWIRSGAMVDSVTLNQLGRVYRWH
jgi:Tfp pilus assembly protein FimT